MTARTTSLSIDSHDYFVDPEIKDVTPSGKLIENVRQQIIRVFRNGQKEHSYELVSDLSNTKKVSVIVDGRPVELAEETLEGLSWYFRHEKALSSN